MRLYILFVGAVFVLLVACRQGAITTADVVQPKKPFRSALDQYIHDSFTVPYNVEVKYRFDGLDYGQENIQKVLVPPREELIRPFLRNMKKVWIDVYEKIAGRDFIRQYIPKQIVLVGSKNYNSDGTVTLGVAEGGKRILLFNINEFNLEHSFDGFMGQMHTMHHEFSHILHQTVLYPPDYRTISSPGDYTAQWYNVSRKEAVNKGFITPYSSASPDEDFVEIISNSVVYTWSKINKKKVEEYLKTQIATAGNNKMAVPGVAMLTKKLNVVETYLENTWKINRKRLEDSVQAAFKRIKTNYDTPLGAFQG